MQAELRNDVRSSGGNSDAWPKTSVTCFQVSLGVTVVPFDFATQPCSGHGPIAVDGARGDGEDFGDLIYGEASEETEIDDAGLIFVERAKAIEALVEGDKIDSAFFKLNGEVIEGDSLLAAAALDAFARFGVVDEDAAHGHGGDGEEVAAIFP